MCVWIYSLTYLRVKAYIFIGNLCKYDKAYRHITDIPLRERPISRFNIAVNGKFPNGNVPFWNHV